ncbi:TPA: 4-alpha-glucanotransferase [Candidatus Acetothermia bacterium]|nr:4-alpha-glucanotransferase [Candidatus Acetothermia bacterium]HAZ30813.1 4-alpha-glucanotransferase [Candidatus Acetothermia bacterium]
MELPRSFGVVLHPTSFPGWWGIGTLGNEARRFLDWLAVAGARWWQVLPLGPTGYGDSPYQSFSTFAGNPYLIDPEDLLARGWLPPGECPAFPAERVDFGRIYGSRWPLLRRAYAGFLGHGSRREKRALGWFARAEAFWLPDYALFMALKARFTGAPWNTWPRELGWHDPRSIAAARRALAEEVGFHTWTQWRFHLAWDALRAYARERGIGIIGDMPIFVSHDSADVWACPEHFYLDDSGNPTVVAGVPPDYFSATGQRWGNPLYRWDVLENEGFAWWIARVRQALRTCDLVRIDHFRGFEAYWEIPATEPTAVRGRWVQAPGQALLDAIRNALGDVPIVAEDLGVITPEVEALRDRFGLPGMRVLQFAFGGGGEGPHLPNNYPPHGRVVVYTGTHDNDTTLGWYRSAPPAERERVRAYLAQNGIPLDRDEEAPWALMRLAFGSRAALAMVPFQDVFSQDGHARMNYPGKPEGNWTWRYQGAALTETVAARLRTLAAETGRVAVSGAVR